MSREVKVIGTRRNLAVERDGNLVILTIRCSSYYEAIELYDNSCKALSETGTLELRVDGATQ